MTTTTPKSKCCGAAAIERVIGHSAYGYICDKCRERCDLQDQLTPQLDDTDNVTCNSNWLKCLEESNCYLSTDGKIISRELTKANEELAELRKDKERLDWLLNNHIEFAEELNRIGWRALNDAQ